MMFVPHVMLLWFREYNGVGIHVDIKIGCNNGSSLPLCFTTRLFLPCLIALQVFVYTEWHKEASEWVHLHNGQCIHWIHPVFSSSFHSLGFLRWRLGKCSLSALPTEEQLPARKLYHRSGPCILLALHTSGLWESNVYWSGFAVDVERVRLLTSGGLNLSIIVK